MHSNVNTTGYTQLYGDNTKYLMRCRNANQKIIISCENKRIKIFDEGEENSSDLIADQMHVYCKHKCPHKILLESLLNKQKENFILHPYFKRKTMYETGTSVDISCVDDQIIYADNIKTSWSSPGRIVCNYGEWMAKDARDTDMNINVPIRCQGEIKNKTLFLLPKREAAYLNQIPIIEDDAELIDTKNLERENGTTTNRKDSENDKHEEKNFRMDKFADLVQLGIVIELFILFVMFFY